MQPHLQSLLDLFLEVDLAQVLDLVALEDVVEGHVGLGVLGEDVALVVEHLVHLDAASAGDDVVGCRVHGHGLLLLLLLLLLPGCCCCRCRRRCCPACGLWCCCCRACHERRRTTSTANVLAERRVATHAADLVVLDVRLGRGRPQALVVGGEGHLEHGRGLLADQGAVVGVVDLGPPHLLVTVRKESDLFACFERK